MTAVNLHPAAVRQGEVLSNAEDAPGSKCTRSKVFRRVGCSRRPAPAQVTSGRTPLILHVRRYALDALKGFFLLACSLARYKQTELAHTQNYSHRILSPASPADEIDKDAHLGALGCGQMLWRTAA